MVSGALAITSEDFPNHYIVFARDTRLVNGLKADLGECTIAHSVRSVHLDLSIRLLINHQATNSEPSY